MYRIVDSNNQTVAFASRLTDAEALIRTQLDKQSYKIIVDTQPK